MPSAVSNQGNPMQDERHLSFKARLENVPAACDFVVQAAESAGLDERAIYHCQLAVDEASTNIIEHGFDGGATDPNGQIHLVTGLDNNTFVIMIADNSAPFNPLTYQEPDPKRTLTEREGGGWGIYFIKKLMDAVDYRYVDGRNTLTLHKYIQHPPATAAQKSLEIVTVSRQGLEKGYMQLNLEGQIDSHTSTQVEHILDDEILLHKHARLVLSFAHVNYISSSGLKVLVSAWRKAREQGGDVLIVELQPRIREVFEMIGFDMMFNIYETPEEAVADDPIK